jgi:hypothetical protein
MTSTKISTTGSKLEQLLWNRTHFFIEDVLDALNLEDTMASRQEAVNAIQTQASWVPLRTLPGNTKGPLGRKALYVTTKRNFGKK